MQTRFSNRAIIGIGLLLCIVAAVALAWLLGLFDRAGVLP
jgi:hypothetical protein